MLTEAPTEYGAGRQQKLWNLAFVPQEQIRVSDGNECMDSRERICQHPKDVEACRRSLIRAWREDSLARHCIFRGLRENLDACRQILRQGLYDEHRIGTSGSRSAFYSSELYRACKQVVLFGYPLRISAVHEVFYETFFRLVRKVIRRCRITDTGLPSADDVFQEALMELHKYLGRGLSVEAPLNVYIARSVVNTCTRLKKSEQKHAYPAGGHRTRNVRHSLLVVPRAVAETWEHLDHQLVVSGRADLIDRIILAHLTLGGIGTDRKVSAKQMMAAWQIPTHMPAGQVEALHSRMTDEAQSLSSKDVVPLVADMINADLVKPEQVAILFAAGTGLDVQQTRDLCELLAGLAAAKIHTRVFRIRKTLRPSDEEEC